MRLGRTFSSTVPTRLFFARHKPFDTSQIPDLTGKTHIVTGASNGIGVITALELARKGSHVVLACRSEARTQAVMDRIVKETGNENIEYMHLEMSSLASIKNFADAVLARFDTLDTLLLNAAIMPPESYTLTADGLESGLGVNCVANAYLSLSLLPLLQQSGPSRIVSVSSEAHKRFRFNLAAMQDPAKYNYWHSYQGSKLALTLFTNELARRLEAQGNNQVLVNTIHPGTVHTDMLRTLLKNASPTMQRFIHLIARTMPVEKGALTSLYTATSPEIVEKHVIGEYIVPLGKIGKCSGEAKNQKHAAELWEFIQDTLSAKAPGYTRSTL
ncbi:hypothetical protein BC940DRAFT_337271 [Gongronella butleri]|nr:hypothetical protein BC940DRAFT_337271 [Gongronella butleri]